MHTAPPTLWKYDNCKQESKYHLTFHPFFWSRIKGTKLHPSTYPCIGTCGHFSLPVDNRDMSQEGPFSTRQLWQPLSLQLIKKRTQHDTSMLKSRPHFCPSWTFLISCCQHAAVLRDYRWHTSVQNKICNRLQTSLLSSINSGKRVFHKSTKSSQVHIHRPNKSKLYFQWIRIWWVWVKA